VWRASDRHLPICYPTNRSITSGCSGWRWNPATAAAEITIIRVTEIEGLKDRDIVRQFNGAGGGCDVLLPALTQLIAQKKRSGDSLRRFGKADRQFEDIRRLTSSIARVRKTHRCSKKRRRSAERQIPRRG
jgi:hypothetical protein